VLFKGTVEEVIEDARRRIEIFARRRGSRHRISRKPA
jgi:hypothetical protein